MQTVSREGVERRRRAPASSMLEDRPEHARKTGVRSSPDKHRRTTNKSIYPLAFIACLP